MIGFLYIQVQKLTERFNEKVTAMLTAKEKEINKV